MVLALLSYRKSSPHHLCLPPLGELGVQELMEGPFGCHEIHYPMKYHVNVAQRKHDLIQSDREEREMEGEQRVRSTCSAGRERQAKGQE